MSRKVVPVSTLVRYLKKSVESDVVLHGVLIEGEISNLRKPYSGHWYFSLKDEKSSISCVMFASSNARVKQNVQNGDKVVVKGDVSVYEAMGGLQIIVSAMQPSGTGDLYLKFEQLKKKLDEEGLFSESHKKKLPQYAMDIALVSGNQTAAREDVLITLKKRWPIAKITEYPAPVQGATAAPKIVEALLKADEGNHQLIILARGGGSIEDLWCFNDESLARCIYALNTPVVTGIGHEIDFTLADFVADYRANTPTGAVEASVPDITEVTMTLKQYKSRIVTDIRTILERENNSLRRISASHYLVHPERIYSEQAIHLQYLSEKLIQYANAPKNARNHFSSVLQTFYSDMHSYSKNVQDELQKQESRIYLLTKERLKEQSHEVALLQKELVHFAQNKTEVSRKELAKQGALLDAYSPLKVLSRGYSIVFEEDRVVKSVDQIQTDDMISVRVSDGTLKAQVKEISYGRKEEDI